MVSSSVTSFCANRNYTCWGEHLIMYIKNFFDSLFMAGMNLEGCEVGKVAALVSNLSSHLSSTVLILCIHQGKLNHSQLSPPLNGMVLLSVNK